MNSHHFSNWSRSLRVRLVLWLTGLCTVSAVALLIGARLYGTHAADRAFDRILYASALAIAEQVYVRNGHVSVDLPYASLAMLGFARNDSVFYRIVSPAGHTVTGYADLPVPNTAQVHETPVFFNAVYRGEPTRFVAMGRLLAEPGLNGWALIQVGQTRNAREALAQSMALSAIVPIIGFMLVIVALVWYGVRKGLAPLHRVESELAQREPTDLSSLDVTAPHEIEALVGSINHFMAQLQQNLDQMQRFIGDATHQIRTPMASLKAQVELAQEETDPERLQYYLSRIEHNASRATRITNQLLSNAVITYRANTDSRTTADLVNILHTALHDAVPLTSAGNGNITVHIECDTAPVFGDVVALREAIRNLIENALQHGPTDESIDISLSRSADNYICTVTDRGPGIAEHELSHVLDRFSRGQNARGAGSGLGLSIVRDVVQQHEGELKLTNRSGGGLCVTIRLPAERLL